jgi:hypothetical protein
MTKVEQDPKLIPDRVLKKKVIVIEETPIGSNIIETIGEQFKQLDRGSESHRRPNVNKKTLFMSVNRFMEKMAVVHYSDNNYLNVFISGGHHITRMALSIDKTRDLIRSLIEAMPKLRKVQSKVYKYDKLRRIWVKREDNKNEHSKKYF